VAVVLDLFNQATTLANIEEMKMATPQKTKNITQTLLFFFYDKKEEDNGWMTRREIEIQNNMSAPSVVKATNELVQHKVILKKRVGKRKTVFKLNPIIRQKHILDLIKDLIE